MLERTDGSHVVVGGLCRVCDALDVRCDDQCFEVIDARSLADGHSLLRARPFVLGTVESVASIIDSQREPGRLLLLVRCL